MSSPNGRENLWIESAPGRRTELIHSLRARARPLVPSPQHWQLVETKEKKELYRIPGVSY
jgi:DNA primase